MRHPGMLRDRFTAARDRQQGHIQHCGCLDVVIASALWSDVDGTRFDENCRCTKSVLSIQGVLELSVHGCFGNILCASQVQIFSLSAQYTPGAGVEI